MNENSLFCKCGKVIYKDKAHAVDIASRISNRYDAYGPISTYTCAHQKWHITSTPQKLKRVTRINKIKDRIKHKRRKKGAS